MKLSTLFLIAVVSTAAIVPFTGCSDSSPSKPEPPVYRYRITHYLPSGEAKVYNALRIYRNHAGIEFDTSQTATHWTGAHIIGGSYLVEEIAP